MSPNTFTISLYAEPEIKRSTVKNRVLIIEHVPSGADRKLFSIFFFLNTIHDEK